MSSGRAQFAFNPKAAPLLNTPDFVSVFGKSTLPLDSQGLLRAVEMVALPFTQFKLLNELPEGIFEVSTPDYPQTPSNTLYTDVRFLTQVAKKSEADPKILPSKGALLDSLTSCLGFAYIWGGNWKEGVPELLAWYPPPFSQEPLEKRTLKGFDCSGLLYYATGGFTPRNTLQLASFGSAVSIAECSLKQVLEKVKPLDMIIWVRHVIIVLDKYTSIESRLPEGVVMAPLESRVSELYAQGKSPSTVLTPSTFVIRRFEY